MAGKQLQAEVVIGGRTTSGFDALASKMMNLGHIVDMVGSHVREWEKESVETYKNYETYMLEAKGAMSANYKSATQLENAYAGLQQKAQEWAASSIFHTNDVAKAISEAAHAGWEYDEMLEGIPRAMVLAQAGNTDLSSGLDMLIKTINGTGIAFEDSGRFVDEWVMAANSSATTVSELGEAMERMGTTARFGNSTGELLTMLAVLADTGTVGAQAGTLLRNSMIRLIAPTKTARESMEALGLTADDINEAVGADGESLAEVNDLLTKAGFSAYTSTGKLKPFLNTFKDLYAATKGMTEEERNKVLSTIFPTRTITGALALLQAAADNYDGLLEKITGSDGYAEKVAGIQTSGLMGSQELFLSKWEEFSRKVGEVISDPLESVYKWAGELVDTLNSTDSATLSAIVGALTTIAGLGPTLMTAGIAMKMISALGPWTFVVAGAAAAGALLGYLNEINQLALENNFGTMSLDMETIGTALQSSGSEISTVLADLREFSGAVEEIQSNYKATGELLSEGLTSKMIAGAKLTPDDIAKFKKYGEDMIQAVKDGLVVDEAEKLELASIIFSQGDDTQSPEELAQNPAFASVVSLIELGMGEAKAKAESLSKELREALTSAFKDGELSEDELKNIQSIIDQMNALMNGLSPNDVEKNKLLLKSQRVSLDTMKDFSEEVNKARDTALAGMDEEMLEMQANLMTYYDWAKQSGQKFIHPVTGELVNPEEVNINDLIQGTQEAYALKRQSWELDYDNMLRRGWDYALSTSDTGKMFTEAQGYLEQAKKGMITFAQAEKAIADMQGDGQLLARSMDQMIEFYGGTNEMRQKIDRYRQLGGEDNLAMADWLQSMVYMREAFGGKINNGPQDSQSPEREGTRGMIGYIDDMYRAGATDDEVLAYYNTLTDVQRKAWDDNVEALKKDYNLADLAREYDQNGGVGLSDQALDWLGAYLISQGIAKVPEEYKWSEYENGPEGYATQVQHEAIQADIQAKMAELNTAQQNLETLQGQQQQMADNIRSRQDWEEHYFSNRARQEAGISDEDYEAYKKKTQELSEEKIQLDADVTAAEEKVSAIEQEITALEEKDPIPLELNTEQAETDIATTGENIMALGELTPEVTVLLDSEEADAWEKEDTESTHTIDLEDGTAGWSPPGDTSSTHTVYIQTVGSAPGGSSGGKSSGGGILGTVKSWLGFAEGGRADTASIFGEAGPEWAIPEEHSQRTADLLQAAAKASGFSWGELLQSRGGLNANAGDINVNIQSYSPTINAGNAEGVAEALAKDKERLSEVVKKAVKTAMDEMSLMNGIEVYA